MSATTKRGHTALDRLGPGAVVLDRYGDAWQRSRRYHLGGVNPTGYWRRAYDGYDASEVSTWELSAFAPFTVLHRGETNERGEAVTVETRHSTRGNATGGNRAE